jgi:hypothetical protein
LLDHQDRHLDPALVDLARLLARLVGLDVPELGPGPELASVAQ